MLGTTQSLCPECLAVVPAKILVRQGRVYFRKHCPTHGTREDFICSDVSAYDRLEYSVPGRIPAEFGTTPQRGCPYDCGLCTEHEQHTCVGLVEITDSCNLRCPMCFASSGPGGKHLSLADACRAIDRLVEVEGRAEVVQLSGGEPTLHPEFVQLVEYACNQPIDVVMINTNGIRLANDDDLLEKLAARRKRLEIYLQFDGLRESSYRELRGEPLLATKLRAVEKLGRQGLRTTLVATLQGDLNLDEVGDLVRFAIVRPWITGVSFQPATYSGRHVLPADLENRVTFPDVVRALVEQCDGLFQSDDFLPLPCAHPNCHTLSYLYRSQGRARPLTRFINAHEHLELLSGGITFNRPRARQLIEEYLARVGACGPGCGCGPTLGPDKEDQPGLPVLGDAPAPRDELAEEFFRRALAEQVDPEDVLRITITSFLDAYNFDLRRLMKCCIHHVLPSGHVVPFCAYNVLYREGHVPLPTLEKLQIDAPVSRAAAPLVQLAEPGR
ncbi:MAG: radical SAM protein [Pirellulales bacterium]|nr:radical SAM protein [Pirellulales bacterium]